MSEVKEEMRLVIVHLQNEIYGIDIFQIDSIINPVKITPVPLVDEQYLGVINVRGTVLPVVSLRKKLGFAGEHQPDEKILILRTEDHELVSLLVDSVECVMPVESEAYTEDIPDNLRNRMFISGVVKREKEIISVLNVESLLGSLLNG